MWECSSRECCLRIWTVFIRYCFDTYFSDFTIVAATAAAAIVVAELLSLCIFFSLFHSIEKAYLSYDALGFTARMQTRHSLHCNVAWAYEIQ